VVHRVGSNGTVTVSAISRIPYLCYCAFCRSSLNELCWWYCILQVVIQMRLVFPGVMPKWTPVVMSSFLNFVHETICYFNWMNKNKKLISIDVLKYSHLYIYIYIYPFIRDRGQIDRYRKHCTNTVPRFIGRRQIPSASWTKKFAKSLKVVQGHSRLHRWVGCVCV